MIKLWWWPMALPFSLHRWCPFTFLTLAGVLIGWLAAPFSRDRVNGGEECEQRSESPLMLALKGPAAEKFWGLKILSLDISQLFEIKRKLCTPFKLDQINGINKVLWTRAGGQSIYGSIVDGQNYPEVIKKSWGFTWWVCVGCCCDGARVESGVQMRILPSNFPGLMEPHRWNPIKTNKQKNLKKKVWWTRCGPIEVNLTAKASSALWPSEVSSGLSTGVCLVNLESNWLTSSSDCYKDTVGYKNRLIAQK